ncbi:nucleotide exchange factor GrpE [Streptomyces sp. NPDC048430]|uniref:nucleotide exchange factor GrpE n=1 Tax=Streptomyces sp. NPDC048430 TaxID=3155388 RepID=UPI00343DF5E9
MIPQLVTVRRRRPDGRWRRLYIPVLPALLVLSPLLLAVVAGLVACRATGVSPGGALRGAGQVLRALPGTRFELRAVGEIAVVNVLASLLPVLDAIDQARKPGQVTGGFQLGALGLRSVGTAGDPFDPAVHEAVSCTRSDHVEQATCTAILRPGYLVGDQLLRPAQAEVTEPSAGR